MGYIENNLVSGETVEMKARVHWAILIWPIMLFVFMFIGTGALFNGTSFLGLLYLFLVLAGIYVAVTFLAVFISTEFALTNRRIIAKTGLIRRHSLELMLSKVESLNIEQGLFARIFNYGTITVIGSGGTKQSFPAIEKPMELRKMVNQAVSSD